MYKVAGASHKVGLRLGSLVVPHACEVKQHGRAPASSTPTKCCLAAQQQGTGTRHSHSPGYCTLTWIPAPVALPLPSHPPPAFRAHSATLLGCPCPGAPSQPLLLPPLRAGATCCCPASGHLLRALQQRGGRSSSARQQGRQACWHKQGR